ncbi:MAG: hypothetical protein WBE76_09175 [Terracidiphilus sp.]
MDSSNNVYIADSGNSEVLKVNTSGSLSIFAGTGTAGTFIAGAATSSKLSSPVAVAADSSGNIYIADSGDHAVARVNTSGTLSYFAGTGTSGSTNDNNGSAATSAKLNSPSGLAVDSNNNVYIADSGNDTVLEVAASTGDIAIVAGTNGSAGFSGDGGAATSAKLHAPKGVGVDTNNNLYISDSTNERIRFVTGAYGTISTIAGDGTAGYTGNGAAATSAEIDAPNSTAASR